MKWLLSFFREKPKDSKCGLCGGLLGEKPGFLQYTALDTFGGERNFMMDICHECSDTMDKMAKGDDESD